MTGHDIVVIGTSAGGLKALTAVLRELPKAIRAAIFVVQHLAADKKSHRGGGVPQHAEDGVAVRERRSHGSDHSRRRTPDAAGRRATDCAGRLPDHDLARDRVKHCGTGHEHEGVPGERREDRRADHLHLSPDCSGAIWKIGDEEPLKLRCHVGHSFTGEVFSTEQRSNTERALWNAVRVMEERVAFSRLLAARKRREHVLDAAEAYENEAEAVDRDVARVRDLIVFGPGTPSPALG